VGTRTDYSVGPWDYSTWVSLASLKALIFSINSGS
jgi:hypothetical protein